MKFEYKIVRQDNVVFVERHESVASAYGELKYFNYFTQNSNGVYFWQRRKELAKTFTAEVHARMALDSHFERKETEYFPQIASS